MCRRFGKAAGLQRVLPVAETEENSPLVLQGNKLFFGKMWQLERKLATEIVRLAKTAVTLIDWLSTPHYLNEWFAGSGSRDQKAAAALSLLQNFMVISGGPGTGKTTTVAKLLALLCMNMQALPRIALVAPTGKAAVHMSRALHRALDTFKPEAEITSHLQQLEGQTVHRLLKLRPPYMQPSYDAENPLPFDILVVDEASMLDTSLLLQLLTATPDHCRVILLGDENQLPSVGAGAVLAALAQETVLDRETAAELTNLLPEHTFKVSDCSLPLAGNITRLTVSHRFGSDSGIGCLARAEVAGDADEALVQFMRFPQEIGMRQMNFEQQAAALYEVQKSYWDAVQRNDREAAFGHQADIMVLAARRKDAEHFNQAYIACLKKLKIIKPHGNSFAGQMIMISRNDYPLDLFNGDIGLILQDEIAEKYTLAAYFPLGDGNCRKVALSMLPDYETAFAITVHKSQGSEYREVWLLPPVWEQKTTVQETGLGRALLYTTITRAKEKFIFYGSEQEFSMGCEADEYRRTALKELLEAEYEK